MENRERYKKIIMFFASVIIVAIETLILHISGIISIYLGKLLEGYL